MHYLQGGLELSGQYHVDARPSMDSICDLIGLYTAASGEEQLLVEELSLLLELPLTDGALLAILSRCTSLANDAAAAEASTATPGLVQEIAAGEPLINVTNVLFLHRPVGPSYLSHSRRLTARSRASGSGQADTVDVVEFADVGDQGWTVHDLPVQYPAEPGTVLRPRMLGHGNEVLGGVQLTQTRAAASDSTCRSRFLQLVSACQGSRLHASGVEVPSNARAGEALAPFGRDPAFNPLSGLFSATAAQNEGAYFNQSAGSEELSADGFPAAFFPRTVNRKLTFIIVLPVSPSHACFLHPPVIR